MKLNRSVVFLLIFMFILASLYRVWEGRPFGFVPHIAICLLGGALIHDKRFAVILPMVLIFISDLLYQILYWRGVSDIPGFYSGQWTNYLLFAGLCVFGFIVSKPNFLKIAGLSLSGSLLYFIFSNFFVWLGGGGFNRPKTWDGLLLCYNDALAFYREYGLVQGFAGNIFLGDLFFAMIIFTTWLLVANRSSVFAHNN